MFRYFLKGIGILEFSRIPIFQYRMCGIFQDFNILIIQYFLWSEYWNFSGFQVSNIPIFPRKFPALQYPNIPIENIGIPLHSLQIPSLFNYPAPLPRSDFRNWCFLNFQISNQNPTKYSSSFKNPLHG